MRCRLRLVTFAFGIFVVLRAPPAGAQMTWTFDKRPLLKIGDVFTADFRFKSQADFRSFPPEPQVPSKSVFDLHRSRVGVEGTFRKRFEYQIEGELHDSEQPWRDVYVQTRVSRALQVRGGHFKIPFSLDQLTAGMQLDFNYRSLAGTFLSPGRDLGVMAFGRVRSDKVRYQAGVFRKGGDNVRESERTDPQADRTIAGRLVFRPWDGSDTRLGTFAAGVAVTEARLPAGPNGVRGRTIPGDAFFERLYVNGHRRRVGAEFQWRPGPLGAQGEFIRVRDDRLGQGIDNEDLPAAFSRGWYLSGTWLVTGERKTDSITPARPFLRGGPGAIEIAGRLEGFASSSTGSNDGSFSSPRSAWVMPRRDDVWTGGVNWYWNDYVKVQVNLIRERRSADDRVIAGQEHLWSRTLRFQFGF